MIIYKATNSVNNKIYVGKTINSLEKRMNEHLGAAFNDNSKLYFHRALRKHGKENFIWEIIYECKNEDELNEKEKFFIKKFDSLNYGYNLTKGGDGGDTYSKLSEEQLAETKRKSSEAKMGHIVSVETRKKISEKAIGRKLTLETKQKIGKANTGKICSEETKRKIGKAHSGKIISKEARKKVSDANSGCIGIKNILLSKEKKVHENELDEFLENGWTLGRLPLSEEHKEHCRHAHEGHFHSDETKLKMSFDRTGEKNSMFGKKQSEKSIRVSIEKTKDTVWVKNTELRKRKQIKKELIPVYLDNGWEFGKKI